MSLWAKRDTRDSFTSWRDHIAHGGAIAAALKARLDPERPPHVGVLLQNTPFFSAVLVAAALTGIVPVGLNPVRRGAALARDVMHADCQVVLADSASATALDVDYIDVDSPDWTAEVAAFRDTPVVAYDADPSDLFMLIYTSGTSGDPKAVKCSQGKVAIAGVTMTQRFSLGPDDVCYVSMPLFHSNAVLVGWAVALGCRGSLVLRRKFSASQFLPDVRRYGATMRTTSASRCPTCSPHPSVRTTRTTRCGPSTATRARRATSSGSRRRFDTVSMDGFGSTEGGIAIGRTPDTPPGALGPLPPGTEIVDVRDRRALPAGSDR